MHFLYLKCSPETALSRISTRGRAEEKTIHASYLAQINDRHEDWVASAADQFYIVNAEQDLTQKNIFVQEYQAFISALQAHKNAIWSSVINNWYVNYITRFILCFIEL